MDGRVLLILPYRLYFYRQIACQKESSMILGVTGGIATGKTIVTEKFKALGAEVVSADQLARDVVRPGSETLDLLAARFGPGILRSDGTLDRQALARLIFADDNAREDLNRITHPAIAELAERRLSALRECGARLVVYEAPLLFEAGAEGRVERILVVTAEPAVQLQRLMGRDHLTRQDALDRIRSQMPLAEKTARADYVIDNSGSREATLRQVEKLFAQLLAGG